MRRATMRTPVISAALLLLVLDLSWAQNPLKKHPVPPKATKMQCCDDVRALKVQVANLTSLLEELSKKQESDRISLVKQVMELEKLNQQQEARVTEAESKYSEINNRVDIMQFQAMQGAPQTTSGKENNEKILYKHSLSAYVLMLYECVLGVAQTFQGLRIYMQDPDLVSSVIWRKKNPS